MATHRDRNMVTQAGLCGDTHACGDTYRLIHRNMVTQNGLTHD